MIDSLVCIWNIFSNQLRRRVVLMQSGCGRGTTCLFGNDFSLSSLPLQSRLVSRRESSDDGYSIRSTFSVAIYLECAEYSIPVQLSISSGNTA
jgi:hypothetical protein